jgi:putative ABC transport system substrate-binding protein
MTTRRQILVAGALGALSLRSHGQSRPPRVGVLSGLSLDESIAAPLLLNALAELGYRDGSGMILEYVHSERIDRYPALARELIARKCDVIFALASEHIARALRDARTAIPVVFSAHAYDPLERGIVESLRRPGGNLTGVYVAMAPLTAKRLEIAQEVLPQARRFLVMSDPHSADQLAALRRIAEERRVALTVVEYSQTAGHDLAAAFVAGRRDKVDGLIIFSSPEFASRRGEISALVAKHKQPLFTSTFMASEPGTLVSYDQDLAKMYQRGAHMGVRILKGAKPADIPVEQADAYQLVVNLKTAKALGLRIPRTVLERATRIIE